MSDRFFTSDTLSPGEYVLTGPEAHHLAVVRRFGPGDRVTLFNGDGRDYPAEVVSTDRKHTVLTVFAGLDVERELSFCLEVAAAMPKGDRGDFLVEKLTELGVGRFTPLHTARAVVQPKESRLDKLQHAVVEASKQCGRNVLMQIGPLTSWSAFASAAELPSVRAIFHPAADPKAALNLADLSIDQIKTGGVVFAIGPEGGFTDAEVATAEAAGWVRVSLGPRVLRVETAAVAVSAWIAGQ